MSQQFKITLKSGKRVVMREPLIRDQETAAIAASPRANGDPTVLQVLMQKELVKLLIVSINEKPLSAQDREQIDSLLSLKEYAQVQMAINKVVGDMKDLGEPQIEVLTSGDN